MSLACRCYQYNSNDLDFNYSPIASPDRSSIESEDETVPVRPDPMAVTKLLSIQGKISSVLDYIYFELDRIPLPDGEDDLHRRQQRVIEFSTRLSRNYLYDLGRQIADIERHMKAITPDCKIRLSRRGIILHMQAIEQKLISAHQLLLAALTAYWKHIPSSVLRNHPGKLKEILKVVVQLKNFCSDIKITPEYYCSGDTRDSFLGKETETRCAAILSKFHMYSDNDSQAHSHRTRSTVVTTARTKKQRNRKMLNRLSMYTADLRLAKTYQPKKSRSMFQMSKDKKHSCGSLKQQHSDMLPTSRKCCSFAERGSCEAVANKTAKIDVPMKEDDIKTMMETVPSDLDGVSARSVKSSKQSEHFRVSHRSDEIDDNSGKLRGFKENAKTSQEEAEHDPKEKNISSLMPVIEDLLCLLQNKQSNGEGSPHKSVDCFRDILQKFQPHGKSSGLNSSGAQELCSVGKKNMRLICYNAREDEACIEEVVETKDEEEIKFNDASIQAHHLKFDEAFKLLVSDSTLSCLTEYRDQYHKTLESNPLYTSSTQNKPWDLVAWIADKLVDELITDVSNEFQIDDVIQKLFELEFQEY
ncbi:hypothetical protein QAD02_011435 [Eretmocerus hayati]|uniref:Uncharacterized protein n=1 Tax=Eretmocerus hayati TaxID=131215 RepID=A0ACC2NZD4_9HYME|nr:hypothetical protein QAD02_011435 [Eretmocerus hayati]